MRPSLALALAAGTLLAAPAAASAQNENPPRGITTQATGVVTAKEDIARFTIVVSIRRPTLKAATTLTNRRIARIVAYIGGLGVARDDIVTESIRIRRTSRRIRGTRERVREYVASQALDVTVRKVDIAGRIVDTAVGAGATDLSGPDFDVSDRAGLYRQALRVALRAAREKAQALADEGGVTLGKLIRVVEGGSPAEDDAASQDVVAETDDEAPTQVRPGTARILAELSATFETG